MKIEKINPHGYCGGVINALKLTTSSLNEIKPIYMLGKIIHNDIVCAELEKMGIIIKTNNKYDALNEINSGTVIFTAHGISDDLLNIAQKKNLNIINATCPKVTIIRNNIKKYINECDVLYFGVPNHPECEAVLSISNNIYLVTSINDLFKLDKSKKYYVTNQTTLSLVKLKDIYDYVKDNFSNAIIDNTICLATTQRQQALLKCTADCIITVGDKRSSNTKELFNIAQSKCTSYLISNVNEIKDIDFKIYKNIKLTSGASTPEYLLDEVYNYLIKNYL